MQRTATAQGRLTIGRSPAEIVGVAVVSLLALVNLGLPAWLLIPYHDNFDEGVYWASLRSLAGGHPIFGEVFSAQPPLFLLGLLPGFQLLGGELQSARAVVLLLSLVAMVSLYLTARSIAGRPAGWIAVLLLASNPRYLGLSSTVMAEVPAIAFELLAIALALAAGRTSGGRRALLGALAGAALAVGVLIKLFVVVAAVPALCYLLAGARRRPVADSARLLGAFAAGGLLVTAAVLAPLWDRRDALYDQVIGFHLDAAAPGSGPLTNLKLLVFPGVQTPLYLLALVVAVLLVRRRRAELVPPLLWGLASLAFLLRLQPLFAHHHVLLTPPAVLIVALAPLALRRSNQEGERSALRGRGALALAAAVLLVVTVGTATTLRQVRQPSANLTVNELMADELRAATGPDDLVVSDEPYVVAMADRQVPGPLVDTSHVRLDTGSLDEAEIEETIVSSGARAVLLTGGRFEKLPGLRRWLEAHFRLVRDFGARRALYVDARP